MANAGHDDAAGLIEIGKRFAARSRESAGKLKRGGQSVESREIVRRAIEFEHPPRLPFFLGAAWSSKLREVTKDFPNDVCDTWEMDRQEAGWFFDNANAMDDWGCQWARTDKAVNMGQVVHGALEDGWGLLDSFRPPDPRNPFYFARIEDGIKDAGDRYVVITSHFNLFERFHMLRGFNNSLVDFYTERENTHRLLDMILEYKIAHLDEAARRFGDRVNGVFLTDDWGTQNSTFISPDLFRELFLGRYGRLYDAVHSHGWHVIQHSCGRINDFVPFFIEAGVDVMNMLQPRAYGIEALGDRFAGKVCFLTTVDIQATLPGENPGEVVQEARDLVKHWSRPSGGLIVFNYGDAEAIGTSDDISEIMFTEFYNLRHYWRDG
jgi:hypothetical protein